MPSDEQERMYYDEKAGIVQKLKTAIMNPSRLHGHVKHDTMKEAALFYIVIALVPLAVMIIAALALGDSIFQLFPQLASFQAGQSLIILSILISYAVMVFGSFLVAGILHIFIRLYGGKGRYEDTYKSFSYGSSPLIIQWLLIFISIWVFSSNFGVVYNILYAVSVIWILVIMSRLASISHKISHIKAFAAVMTPAAIALIALLAIAAFSVSGTGVQILA